MTRLLVVEMTKKQQILLDFCPSELDFGAVQVQDLGFLGLPEAEQEGGLPGPALSAAWGPGRAWRLVKRQLPPVLGHTVLPQVVSGCSGWKGGAKGHESRALCAVVAPRLKVQHFRMKDLESISSPPTAWGPRPQGSLRSEQIGCPSNRTTRTRA